MKRLYWRPKGVSRTILILLSVFCASGLVVVENMKTRTRQPYYNQKLAAARLALRAMKTIKAERLARFGPLDIASDPAQSGMIGHAMTEVTSSSGSLMSKQTSQNPNFAAVIVHMLRRARVEPGDQIAVGYSGSFPTLNLCVLAAAEVMRLKPVIIASAAASQFGANHPDFTWLDMERILSARRVLSSRSVAATVGGIEDLALGMADEGRAGLRRAIDRNGVRLLQPTSFDDSIARRIEVYEKHSEGKQYAAYINVGGGSISVGRRAGSHAFDTGLNLRPPPGSYPTDSIMTHFIHGGVPVIHLVRVPRLAEHYGLPIQPTVTPRPGEGGIFFREEYNQFLVAGVLLSIILSLYMLVRSDLGFRLLATKSARQVDRHPEPMI